MRRNFTLLFFAIVLCHWSVQGQELTQKSWSITFETDQYAITTAHELILEEVVDFIGSLENEPEHISIEGHTDNVGDFNYNKKLSDKRANAVQDFLIEYGIDERWIMLNGLSYSDPVADNQSESNRSKNRRTEIVVIYKKIEKQTVEAEQIVAKVDTVAKPETKLEPEPKDDFPSEVVLNLKDGRAFQYRCGQDIKIIGFDGVEIQVDQAAIKDCQDGMKITADVKALINPHDIMRSKASTRSGKTLLRSAGMVFVNLYANGKMLRVNGCSVIYIPGPKVKGMRPYLFRGYRAYYTNLQNINWRLQNRNAAINYDDDRRAYRFEYCGSWGYGGIGANADIKTETVVTKIRRNYNLKRLKSDSRNYNQYEENHMLAVTFQDGSVTNLVPFYQGNNKFKRWWYRKYYYFPLHQQPAKLKGAYTSVKDNEDDLLMRDREKTYQVDRKLKIRYKPNGQPRGLVRRKMNGQVVKKLWNWRYRFKFKARRICWKNGKCKQYGEPEKTIE